MGVLVFMYYCRLFFSVIGNVKLIIIFVLFLDNDEIVL